jgi:hypothetical protein
VLFEMRFWDGIRDGSVTVTFRRWKRPQAKAGNTNRTPAGIVRVDSVDVVDPAKITNADARRSGFSSAAEVRDALKGSPDLPVYRVAFHLAEEPDPRAELQQRADLSDEDVAELDKRLDRLDAASSYGPWTRQTLALIAERPQVRAGDLAEAVGRERLPFKADVRKLKALGLTISFSPGYRLSPRGEAYLRRRPSG